MDIVVKKVLDAAVEVGDKAVGKLKKIADESRVTSDIVRKVVDYSKKQCKKATCCASNAKQEFQKHTQNMSQKAGGTIKKAKSASDEFGGKINDVSQKVSREIQHSYGELEKQKMYYDLGKMVYRQSIEHDTDKYSYFIVDKISKIAKQNKEEDKLRQDGEQASDDDIL
ncbi:MAG TPA: hypothetical protein PK629_07160 [Oscillospiraceae bacterium]|nr:hypothetical protein [Oscillospiraceae bacterium]HPK34333.1 hypothetical protein [Oscillospiraceae bacterium]HPR75112.1 hypothetical protein [Oscillospiraceae bacterium]